MRNKINNMVVCGIYKITSPTGKVYIGQSVNIYKAWNCRYKNGHCKNQSKLYNSIKKYGWEAHKREIIHQISEYNLSELDALEKYYEELYDSTNPKTGLNLRKGGGSHGKMSEQSRKKMSESKKGEKNYWFGKTHSEEVRNKIRIGNTGERSHMFGKDVSSETRKKLSESSKGERNAMFGKPVSLGTRQKIREFHNGKKWSLGKKASIETKIKMSERRKGSGNGFFGKHHTEESIQKANLKKSKILLNTQTGIFYIGIKDAAYTVGITHHHLSRILNGRYENYTNLICV